MNLRQCRADRLGRNAQTGFSLIEIVAAFAILALGMGLCMEIATSAMRQSRQAAEYTQAALNAKSLLDTVGIAERLEEGGESGEFDERYRWELSVTPYESEVGMESGLDTTATGVELYRLELVVTWQAGRGQREARFATLRALSPDVSSSRGF